MQQMEKLLTGDDDAKAEIQREYAGWNKSKKLKRAQRSIHVQDYSLDQIYHQLKRVTDLVIGDVEEQLAAGAAEDGDSTSEEESTSDEDSDFEEDSDEEYSDDGSDGSTHPSDDEDGEDESDTQYSDYEGEDEYDDDGDDDEENSGNDNGDSDEDNDDSEEEDSDEDSDEDEDGEEETEGELSLSVNSEENELLTNYLEGNCEYSDELMDEPAGITLKKITGTKRHKKTQLAE